MSLGRGFRRAIIGLIDLNLMNQNYWAASALEPEELQAAREAHLITGVDPSNDVVQRFAPHPPAILEVRPAICLGLRIRA
jgi:hypothetical protein